MENTPTSQLQGEEHTKQLEVTPEQWLKDELAKVHQAPADFEEIPSLQFVENKIIEFEIRKEDMPFEEWDDTVNKVKKKIIKVTHEGQKKNLWLNVRNPLYRQILERLEKGLTHCKVLQTGNKQTTKYTLIED